VPPDLPGSPHDDTAPVRDQRQTRRGRPAVPPNRSGPALSRLHRALALAALVAAGLAGNYFGFTLFANADFVFGSIFSMLALQILGLGPGLAAALAVSSVLCFTWGHPYAMVFMTAEAGAVGWLNRRRRFGYLQADVVYWAALGMPLVYVLYHYGMGVPADSTRFIMVKITVNGLANVLAARLLFSGWAGFAQAAPLPYREVLYNLLATFVLGPTLVMLAVECRRDFTQTGNLVERRLVQETRQTSDMLNAWVQKRKMAIASLAELAAATPPRQLQPYLRNVREADSAFLRLGLLDREAKITAFYPLLDELGRPNIGKSFADRPYLPQLKWERRPMVAEVVPGRTGVLRPVIPVLAPVLAGGEYRGFVIGVLNLEEIRTRFLHYLADHGTLFTLVDRNNRVLMTNRSDQRVMESFQRGEGTLTYVDQSTSRWEPVLPPRTPTLERWGRTLWLTESPIGSVSEWRLILEQPLAPFQQDLFANYRFRFSLMLALLVASLASAEMLSLIYAASLREGEEKFRSLFDSLTEGVALYELVRDRKGRVLDGRVLDVNPAFQRHTGIAAERARGALGADLLGFAPQLEQFREIALAGRPCSFETFFPTMDKHFRVSVLATTRGQFATVLEDITERKQKEATLTEAYRFSQQILHSAQEGIIVYGPDLRYRVWNSYMEQLSGTPAGELLGRHPLEAYPFLRETGVMERLERALAGAPVESRDYPYRFPDRGRTGWAMDSTGPMRNSRGEIVGVIRTIRDITDRKLAEQENAKLQAQLQQAQKMDSLGLMVAGVAHNINNVLAIVMGTASLREELVAEPADREAYQSIARACRRGREVVKSLIQFGRPELANQAPLDLHGLIREVRVLLENTSRNRIRVTEAFADEPIWIHGDAGSINHVLMNLCLNALDAMADGGTLTLRTAGAGPDWAEISVEDDGAGIAPEVLAHVMEPFYTTKEVGKGTGLGLSMSYGVVSAHGGTIEIASQPGRGTTVTLRLPRVPAPLRSEPAPAPAPSLRSLSVLLVDDDDDVRFLMTRLLKKAGVRQVKTLAGGAEAVACLEAGERPDLVILDQNMPGLNGTQTLERIRALVPDMPILISSGQPDIEGWDCFQRPGVGVISKPFSLDEIRAKLAQFAQAPG